MRTHPVIGAEIIGEHESDLLDAAKTIALTHHERWDGKGYPSGLKGEAIPLEGRIVAVADVFDALISVRPYKPAYSVEDSLKIMDAQEGSHFDPALMAAFRRVLPDILEVMREYADEKGALTDVGLATDLDEEL